jgi:ferredoxin
VVEVDLATCIRCAACSTLAPQVFEVTKKGTRVVRQPESESERALVRVAALVCPTKAVR